MLVVEDPTESLSIFRRELFSDTSLPDIFLFHRTANPDMGIPELARGWRAAGQLLCDALASPSELQEMEGLLCVCLSVQEKSLYQE